MLSGVVSVALTAAGPLRAQVVINELYYDHPGADGGHEFVELFNASPLPVPLSALVLQFHNGAGSGWTDIWRGPPGEIAPGALFVIGGDAVAPTPDAIVSLSLQNGPDAVRVLVGGAGADVVGYGGLDDPAYVEGRSAPAVAPGQSLARIPDGADSDDNGADFHAAAPSPGARNLPARNLALSPAAPTALRGVLGDAGVEILVLAVRNTGTDAVAAGAARLTMSDSSAAGVVSVAATALDAVPPGGALRVEVPVALARGYHFLRALLLMEGDERRGDDAIRLVRRAGGTGVVISEVHAAPRAGCPQFVELHNVTAQPVDLAGYGLRDHSHAPVRLARPALVIEAGAALAVTPDRDALLACHPGTPAARVTEPDGGWPTLNRTGSPVADSVVVTDAFGLTVDAVSYPAPPAGLSLERVTLFEKGPSVWAASSAPGGATPGRRARRATDRPPPPGTIEVVPNPFAPRAGETLRVIVGAAAGTGRVAVRVFAVSGRAVAELGVAAAFPAVFVWDGRDSTGTPVLPGIFVVACEFELDGGARRVEKVVVGCAGS